MKLSIQQTAIALAILTTAAVPIAHAVPNLQLDALGGYYDSTLADSVSNDPTFDLRALLGSSSDLPYTFYISIAVLDSNDEGVANGTNFGSFSFAGTTYNSLAYGTPNGLQTHGVFPTLYTEQSFLFSGAATTGEYDVASNLCEPEIDNSCVSSTKSLYYKDFAVNAEDLLDGYNLHFDLYRYVTDKKGNIAVGGGGKFAPFSHDASTSTTTQVPEPGSMALLAAGLFGLAATRRFAKKS